jgi:hypothetical protein
MEKSISFGTNNISGVIINRGYALIIKSKRLITLMMLCQIKHLSTPIRLVLGDKG